MVEDELKKHWNKEIVMGAHWRKILAQDLIKGKTTIEEVNTKFRMNISEKDKQAILKEIAKERK